jgi:hypothetical protein
MAKLKTSKTVTLADSVRLLIKDHPDFTAEQVVDVLKGAHPNITRQYVYQIRSRIATGKGKASKTKQPRKASVSRKKQTANGAMPDSGVSFTTHASGKTSSMVWEGSPKRELSQDQLDDVTVSELLDVKRQIDEIGGIAYISQVINVLKSLT